MRFRDECKDFFRFLRHPRLAPRLPGGRVGSAWRADWCAGVAPLCLLRWVLLLWVCNLLLLGPVAVMAAQLGGAQHRFFSISSIPWLQAVLWAPVVEELLFRYGLRRIGQTLMLMPVMCWVLFYGMQWFSGVLLLLALLVMTIQTCAGAGTVPWRWRRAYQQHFAWVFYAVTLLFAVVHLANFQLQQTPLWLWPLLVLPQLATGLVLGWLRVRRGIGAAILLHAMFNGGPLLVLWLLAGKIGLTV